MKKKLYVLWTLMAVLALSFASCSSDDNDNDSGSDLKSSIVGVWESTHLEGNYWDENENDITVDRDVTGDERVRFQFTDNGDCKFFVHTTGDWEPAEPYDCTYTVSGSDVIIYEGKELYQKITILSLTKDTTLFEYYMDGSTKPTHLTLTKVQ
nr:lipocalin family protein [uncultured Prevotella sp.]